MKAYIIISILLISFCGIICGQDATFIGKNAETDEIEMVSIDYNKKEAIHNGKSYLIIKRPERYNVFKRTKTVEIECSDDYLQKITIRCSENLLTGRRQLFILQEGMVTTTINLPKKRIS